MGKFEGKIATNWPSEREKIKKGLKIDIEWLCPHAFNLPTSEIVLLNKNKSSELIQSHSVHTLLTR